MKMKNTTILSVLATVFAISGAVAEERATAPIAAAPTIGISESGTGVEMVRPNSFCGCCYGSVAPCGIGKTCACIYDGDILKWKKTKSISYE